MPTIDVDFKSFMRDMTALQQEQIPFALKNGLNATALAVQTAERRRLREVFTIRQDVWADRSIKMTHFATKAERWATVAISPPGRADRSDILGKFETESSKQSIAGRHVAIPIAARRNKKDIVTKANRPSALHLRKEGNRVVGDKRTFLVNLKDGRQLILQRTGRGRRSDLRALFYLVERVQLTPDLHYMLTAEGTITREWNGLMEAALDQALRTAR